MKLPEALNFMVAGQLLLMFEMNEGGAISE